MLSKKIEKLLQEQIEVESNSSYAYLAMASWCEVNGLEGGAAFFYNQSDEERIHMLKLFKYLNEKGGHAMVPVNSKAKSDFKNIIDLIKYFHDSEKAVSASVNKLVYVANQEQDYTTLNFLQWYVSEQHEEETLARNIQDKIKLIGLTGNGLYLIDNEIAKHATKKKPTAISMGAADGAE
jgi:ferritin